VLCINPTEGAAFCLMRGILSHLEGFKIDIYQTIYALLTKRLTELFKAHTALINLNA